MKKVLRKSKLVAGILVLVVVCLGIVLAGDVVVKEGNLNVSGDLTTTGTGTFGTGGVRLLDAWDNYMSLKFSGFEEDVTLTLALDYDATMTLHGNTFLDDWFDQDVKTTGSPSFAGITTTGTVESVKFKSTDCTADGTKAVAFGIGTTASGHCSTAMGYGTEASWYFSTAMGCDTTASGESSTAMGIWSEASGMWSTAMGCETTASNNSSTAMGYETEASGVAATAMGCFTTASGRYSTAMGYDTTAGPANHTTAIGSNFTNNVQESFAVGFGDEDFRVTDDNVDVYGDLDVTQKVTMGTLVLPVKSTTGDPASPIEGQIYVNTEDNKVRVYADGAWRDLATW